jgi:hypothetical protein
VRSRLRAIVESEDSFHGADELRRKRDIAFADPVGNAFDGLMDEGDAEGLLHRRGGSGEFDGSAFGVGGVGCDGQTELAGEGVDKFDGGWVGAVVFLVLRAGKTFFSEAVSGLEGLPTPNDDGDRKFGGRRYRLLVGCLKKRSSLSTRQGDAWRRGERGSEFLFCSHGQGSEVRDEWPAAISDCIFAALIGCL